MAFDLATHRRLRFRPPSGAGRCRYGGRRDRFDPDMRQLFDGIDLSKVSVSMTMNGAVPPILALPMSLRLRSRALAPEKLADHPERHPQRVHGPQHLHLSAEAVDADHLDIFAYTSAEDASSTDLHFGLSHPRSRSDSGSRACHTLADGIDYIKAGPRRGPGHRHLRAPVVILLGHRDEFLHGGRKTAGGPVVVERACRRVRFAQPKSLSLRTHSQTSGWSLTAQDVYNNVARTCIEAMAATQGHTQSLHTNVLTRRWRCPPTNSARIARNTACPPAGIRNNPAHRPVGGFVLRRMVDPPVGGAGDAHIAEVAEHGGMAQAIGDGIPKLRIEEAAAHPGPDRLRAAAGDRCQQIPRRRRPGDRSAKVDNSRVRDEQLAKLHQLRADRDSRATKAALDELTRAAAGAARTGGLEGNLLALAINAARAKATVGEISDALEQVYGRHQSRNRTIAGIYRDEVGAGGTIAGLSEATRLVEKFAEADGRRPRILVAKMGRTATTAARR